MKKIISILLSFIMILALSPVSATQAADVTVIFDEDFTGAPIGDALFATGNVGAISWGVFYANYGNTTTTIKFDADPDDPENPVVLFERTTAAGAWQYLGRRFGGSVSATGTIKDGVHNVKFRMRKKPGSTGRTFQFNIWDTSGSSPISFDFKEDTVTMNATPTGYAVGNVPIHDDKWNDVELEIDQRDSGPVKLTIYVNGVLAIENCGLRIDGTATANNGNIGEIAWRISPAADTATEGIDSDGFYARFMLDDVLFTKIDASAVKAVKLSEDLESAEIEFTHTIDETTLENMVIDKLNDDSDDNADNIGSITGEGRKYTVEFNNPLVPGFVDYRFSFDGVSDFYGNSLDGIEKIVTTSKLGEIDFYDDLEPDDDSTPIEDLSGYDTGDSITAAFKSLNNSTEDIGAALIMVQRGTDGTIKSVSAADASTTAQVPEYKAAVLELKNYVAGDTVEAYLWNSIAGMLPLADGKEITSDTKNPISVGKGSALLDSEDSISADLTNPSSDNMKITVSGTAAKADSSVTAYVLKPSEGLASPTVNDLTFENFATLIDFVGQSVSDEEGNYNFDYIVTNGQEGKTYNSYVSGYAVEENKNAGIIFFSAPFVRLVVDTVAAASAEDIADMLAEGKYITDLADFSDFTTDDILLNSVLNLDLSGYNALTNYTTKENFKERVAIALKEGSFDKKEDIAQIFDQSVTTQTTNENTYKELLATINADGWSELEETLNDETNKSLTQLDWEGSYASIKDNSEKTEVLYKKLANEYTFGDFDELRAAFENESKALILTENGGTDDDDDGGDSTGSTGSGGSGGGGGRKDVSYDTELGTSGELEVLDTKTDVKINFDDLDSVPWAKDAIVALAQEEILAGMGDNKFAPDVNVTREQFIKMVVLAFDLYDENAQARQFMDVGINSWYEKYVASAVNCGIIYGMDEEHFGVGKELSRAEMAAILDRICKYKGVVLSDKTENSDYADSADIPPYAHESIMAMSRAGIMNGVGNNTFAPQEKTTRAMAARVIWLLRGEK